MKLSTFFTINAIMFIPFGVGMLVMPSVIFPMLDVNLDPDGMIMASTVGSMLLSFGLVCLFSRSLSLEAEGLKAILIGNLVFHAIDCVLTFKGALGGEMNSLGFMFSGIHFLFAVGFGLFLRRLSKN